MEDSPSKEASRSKTPEESALSRVCEIDAPGTLFYVTTVDHLTGILRHGIVSLNLAKKLGISYQMRWKGHSNPDLVYMGVNKADEREDWNNLEKFTIQISHPNDARGIAVLILDDKTRQNSEKSDWNAERLIRDRIPQQHIIGIAIGGSMEPAIYDYLPQRKTITSLTKDHRLIGDLRSKALQTMNREFGGSPEKYVPIYDLKGNILWPKKVAGHRVSS